MVHSDRGVQYASTPYRNALARHGLIASMSRRDNCYDNAAMESFWSTLKLEHLFRSRFHGPADAHRAIFPYIEGFYNTARFTPLSVIGRRSTSNLSATNHIQSAQPCVRRIGASPGPMPARVDQIEANHVADLIDEERSGGKLADLCAMGLKAGFPNPMDGIVCGDLPLDVKVADGTHNWIYAQPRQKNAQK